MLLSTEGHQSTTEEIVLDSELGSKRAIDLGQHLVACKQVEWVVDKVVDRKELGISNRLDTIVGDVSLLVQRNKSLLLSELFVLVQELGPLVSLFEIVTEKEVCELLGGFRVRGT
jgi:hypothetical protein